LSLFSVMLAMEEHMSEGTGHGIITTTAKQFARHRSHLATTDVNPEFALEQLWWYFRAD